MSNKTFTNTSKKLLWLSVGSILLINAFILGKVYVNRTQVIAELELNERELRLPHNYGFAREDSSTRVSLQWNVQNPEPVGTELRQWRWHYDRSLSLSAAHFSSFTFPACQDEYRSQEKHMAWVLLEFNGQSYADYLAQAKAHYTQAVNNEAEASDEVARKQAKEKRSDAKEFLDSAQNTSSRLFVIDAAANKELMEQVKKAREVTSGKLLIVPAEIQASYHRCNEEYKKSTNIIVQGLAVQSLYIPRDFAQGLPKNIDHNSNTPPRFTATISYGRLHEPWVTNLKLQ